MAHRDETEEILRALLAHLHEENKKLKKENQQLQETNRLLKKQVRRLHTRLWDTYNF